MENITISRMLEIQAELQKKNQDSWSPVVPENGHYSVLWAVGEIGEVIDIIKKRGHAAIMNDADTRADFVKEIIDVMMYLSDTMRCFQISPEEFTRAYEDKHAYNMNRWG